MPSVVSSAAPSLSVSYFFGPFVALAALGVIVMLMRWTFSRGGSFVRPQAQQGRVDQYGLLVPVDAPADYYEAEAAWKALEGAGVRATLASTLQGPRIMVFPEDVAAARAVLDRL